MTEFILLCLFAVVLFVGAIVVALTTVMIDAFYGKPVTSTWVYAIQMAIILVIVCVFAWVAT